MNRHKKKSYYVSRLIKLCKDLIDMSIYIFISLIYKDKKKYKDSWIICERGTEAKDNGYKFFKYLRENHEDKKVYYIIDNQYLNDYKRVAKYGNIIQYGSFEHKMAFILSDKLLSTHIGTICPWSFRLYKKIFDLKDKKKFIRLAHGVIKDDLRDNLNKNTTNINLFITSSDRERSEILNGYGYKEEEVVCTGLARFDDLYEYKEEKYILFMPTWRRNIAKARFFDKNIDDEKLFINSNYYRTISDFLNNKKLQDILSTYNYKLIFYSSVFFDFAYMMKPSIYYQFDRKEFFEEHYKKGYFEYDVDGFGDVIESENDVVNKILYYLENNFTMEYEYKCNVEKFFKYRDTYNCKRIFDAINSMN